MPETDSSRFRLHSQRPPTFSYPVCCLLVSERVINVLGANISLQTAFSLLSHKRKTQPAGVDVRYTNVIRQKWGREPWKEGSEKLGGRIQCPAFMAFGQYPYLCKGKARREGGVIQDMTTAPGGDTRTDRCCNVPIGMYYQLLRITP